MALRAGERLGPYEILGPLGAGGMGEVYRARDPRLEREVAVKVLPADVAGDPERLRRFEQEARSSGSLSHPNVLVVYDVGSHEEAPYLVTELLEGETLRRRLEAGPIPVRKAVDCALQTARGLAAAHERGIVHRDLKPENLFLTNDGVVKILDFGLARLDRQGDGEATTETPGTRPGALLGTVGYMSPEQVRGGLADHRSDLFALGVVLYEMLSGARAFRRPTSVETLNAILKEEPPEFPEERKVPPALDRIVRHCLEKKPQDRVQSTRDLVFELEGLADASGSGGDRTKSAAASHRRRRWVVPTAVGLLAIAAASAAFLAGRHRAPSGSLRFQRLTFRRGPVWSARFTPDGQSIVYGAAWDGQPIRLFTTRPGSAESRPMDLPDADLLAISRDGEMALSLDRNRRYFIGWTEGKLARAPLGGGAPRPLLEHVVGADWSPDGRELAIVRAGPEDRVEYPIGQVLFRQEQGVLCCARVSRKGDAVAFAASNRVLVVDRSGKVVRLTPEVRGGPNSLAWSPDGREIWFGASFRDEWAIYGVDLRGHLRVVAELPLAGHLYDVAPDGRALLTIQEERGEMFAAAAGSPVETNLSWLDWSHAGGLSRDGRFVAFRETARGGGRTYPWYVRRTDGSEPAVRVVEESTWNGWVNLSPDASRVVQTNLGDPRRLRLVPVGPGEPRTIDLDGVDLASGGLHLLEDNQHVVLCGREPGRPARSWAVDLTDGRRRPLTPEGQCVEAASPDGRVMVTRDSGRLILYSIDGGPPRSAPGPPEAGALLGVTTDGSGVFVRETDETGGYTARIVRRDLATGRRETWKDLRPSDQTGIIGIRAVVSADGRTYAYSISRSLSSLYVVEGLQ